MILSICIATIPERAKEYASLLHLLGKHESVEIVSDGRPRGSVSIGQKRNDMVSRCGGEYIVHIDDDDQVPYDYVSVILKALESKPDCVGHYELVEGLSPVPQLSKWTNAVSRWDSAAQAARLGVSHIRTPFHKTPIKADIVRAIGFADMHDGEDHEFSKRLKASGRIKTEVFIHRVLYIYRYTHMDRNEKFGIK